MVTKKKVSNGPPQKGRKPKPTKSIQRMIKVYAESMEQHSRWVEAAENANTSISRFFREIVDTYVAGDWIIEKSQKIETQIAELENKNSLLSSENSRLHAQLKRLEQNLRTTEKELHDIKYGSLLDSSFAGERELNQELINYFKAKKRLREEDIATMLHLSPNDSKSNEIIMNQIEILIDYGLVKRVKGAYQWQQ